MMADASETSDRRSTYRRWVALVLFGAFFAYILWQVINPYRGQRYAEIPHGDHVHYVPKDRDTEVPVNRFPTQPPEPDERILPDGEVVPREPNGQ